MNHNFQNKKYFTLLLSLLLVACSSVETKIESTNQTQNSAIATENTKISQAERVVTLTSLTTDIIEQLDSNKLVGIPGSRLTKEDPRFQDLPRVTEGRTPPDLEKIVSLKPDLVIGAEGFSDQTLAKLEELGIQTSTLMY
ncbi:MAG: ABC transporter substrate-binding protein [Cyanobacteria bacterium P01_F01_bin.143]